MRPTNFAQLESFEDFDFLADDMVLDLIDRMEAQAPVEAMTLINVCVALFQLPPTSKLDQKRKALRSMTLGNICKLWRFRQMRLPGSLHEELIRALDRWMPFLEARVAERRPRHLEAGVLGHLWVGLFRRRLARFAPEVYRELGFEFASAPDNMRVSDWVVRPPPTGPSEPTRKVLERLFESRGATSNVSGEAASASDVLEPKKLGAMSPAERALAHFKGQPKLGPKAFSELAIDVDSLNSAIVLRSTAIDGCQEDLCFSATCSLQNPRQPVISCGARGSTFCTLQHAAAEVLDAAVSHRDYPSAERTRAAILALYNADPLEHLRRRVRNFARLHETEPEGELAWLLTPYERLDLVWLSPRKKGGMKYRRLTLGEANAELDNPTRMMAASLLKANRMFQDKRSGADSSEILAPVLAILAGKDKLAVHLDGDNHWLTVSVDEVVLAPVRFDETVEFALMLGKTRIDHTALKGRDWVLDLDVKQHTLKLGLMTPRLRIAARDLVNLTTEVTPEKTSTLTETLLELNTVIPMRLDTSFLGEKRPLRHGWILTLEWHPSRERSFVRATLRVKVVPELYALTPGEGREVLPLEIVDERGEKRICHVVRDFVREREEAKALADELNLSDDALGFAMMTHDLDEAIGLVGMAQTLADEGRIELVWDSKPIRKRARKPTDKLRLQLGLRKDWFDIKGGLILDGTELPLKALLQGIRDKKRFVAVDDETIIELDDVLRRNLGPLASALREQAGKTVMSPLATPVLTELESTLVEVEGPSDWANLRTRVMEAASLSPPPPRVDAELRPYQREGFEWLVRVAHWARGACLADDMGLGKTLQALAFIRSRAEAGPTLVIAPTSVVPNWGREARRFTPDLVVHRVLIGASLEEVLPHLGPMTVLVTSWDILVRHTVRLSSAPNGQRWRTVALDEAHAMKNAATRRAQAARSLEAEFILALTGTPVENRPMELWSLFSVVAPGLLGSAEQFRDEFARPIEEKDEETARSLALTIRPFILRRTKSEVATDLPKKTEIRVDIVLTNEERERYEKLRRSAVRELDALGPEALSGQKGIIRVLAVLTRLRQLACHPRLVHPDAPLNSSKLDRLLELADELRGEGRKMLVFSQFTELLGLVKETFDAAHLSYAYLDGSTSSIDRERAVEQFQSGKVDAFLLSLKAGGVGLNLTTATEVIHLDPWWNPAVEDQASDRAHRIGQDKPVTVYRLVANETIEDQILSLHADKRKMVSSLLDGTTSSTPFTPAEMVALLIGGAFEASPQEEDPDIIDITPEPRVPLGLPAPKALSTARLENSKNELLEIRTEDDENEPDQLKINGIYARALSMLEEHPEGLSKSEFVSAIGLTENQWSILRLQLSVDPLVATHGRGRSTTYKVVRP